MIEKQLLYIESSFSQVAAVNTPITLRSANGLHIAFHEANLTNYASQTLQADANSLTLKSVLTKEPDGIAVRLQGNITTPWRTVQVGQIAAEASVRQPSFETKLK